MTGAVLNNAINYCTRLLESWLKSKYADGQCTVESSIERRDLVLSILYLDSVSQKRFFSFKIRLLDIELSTSIHPFLTRECRRAFDIFLAQPHIPPAKIDRSAIT
jgi:hypothetical protein